MDYTAALAYLDEHINLERMLAGTRPEVPSLDRMRRLCSAMGDPQHAQPVVHLTGTNGKGSTTQLVTQLLLAQGLSVGTFTSPHLDRVNERLCRNGEPISDEEFAEQVAALADLEGITGVRPSWFELLAAAAFRWFADVAVDVAVVEVGMLGRWDATNVADGTVAVVTNIALDHTEYAGPTRAHIAAEKAGIIKPGSTLVLGERDPDLFEVFAAQRPSAIAWAGEHFEVLNNQLALGGRLLDLRTPQALYRELYLPLHGAHQGDNAVVALCAVEAFFDAPLALDVVQEAFAAARMPGRFEVLGHQPLVIVDGAHNPAGADVCASVLAEDFDPAGEKHLVVGMLRSRDPVEMLEALRAEEFASVVCCTPPSPRALPAADLADAARRLGLESVEARDDVAAACDVALRRAGPDDAVLVAGSLYVVAAARQHLRVVLP
ncbi:MAG: bifunctional folylpolyglutamate synthase/dihydrofolate synthase [Acidimicrobiales bacterium]